MRSVFTKTSLLGSFALAAAALTAPASAQDRAGPMHAELGTLTSVETVGDHQVVTAAVAGPTQVEVQRSYRTTPTTRVEGLGSIMRVEDITPRSNGTVVVVTFTREGQDLIADKIRFTGDREVRVAHGTVLSVDHADETLVLQAEGERQRMDLDHGYGAMVDSRSGLITPQDLRMGQEVTVYYADLLEPLASDNDLTGYARLIVRTTS